MDEHLFTSVIGLVSIFLSFPLLFILQRVSPDIFTSFTGWYESFLLDESIFIVRSSIDELDSLQSSAPRYSAPSGHVASLEYLLSKGCAVTRSKNGNTPLHVVSEQISLFIQLNQRTTKKKRLAERNGFHRLSTELRRSVPKNDIQLSNGTVVRLVKRRNLACVDAGINWMRVIFLRLLKE